MMMVTSKSPKLNVRSIVRGENSNMFVQNRARSWSWRSVDTTTAGSGAALTARTNFFEGSSVNAFCIIIKRSSAAMSRLTPGGQFDSLCSVDTLDLKFVTCFSSRGSCSGADACSTPPTRADNVATTLLGPSMAH